MTRRVVANLFYSVDGVAADPNLFQHDSFDDDLAALMTEGISRIDANVLGRVTYDGWAPYWPTAVGCPEDGFAQFINGTPKYLASRTVKAEDIEWENTELIEGDLVEFVRALKETDGGDIAVQGSLSVVRQLVEAGLMDSLTLIVHPVVAGSGRGLFEGAQHTRLRLVEAKATQKGNVLLTYGPFEGRGPSPGGGGVGAGPTTR